MRNSFKWMKIKIQHIKIYWVFQKQYMGEFRALNTNTLEKKKCPK